MTEPLSLPPLRFMRKAKEPPRPPHRVTLSSGEKGESQRKGFFSVPHPLLVTQLPLNQILTSLPPGLYLGGWLCPLSGVGGGWSHFPSCPFYCFPDPSSALGVGAATHIPCPSEVGHLPLTPEPHSQGRALVSHLWASFCQSWTRAQLSKLPHLDQKPKLRRELFLS